MYSTDSGTVVNIRILSGLSVSLLLLVYYHVFIDIMLILDIQALGNSLVEWEVDSPQSVQIINLMQAIQIQLMSEMQSPASSSHSPKTPRLSTCSSPDSPVDRAARFHREIAGVLTL